MAGGSIGGIAFHVWPPHGVELLASAADSLLSGRIRPTQEQRARLVRMARTEILPNPGDGDPEALVDYVLHLRSERLDTPGPPAMTVALSFQESLTGIIARRPAPPGWDSASVRIAIPGGVASGQRLRCFRRSAPDRAFVISVQVAQDPVFARRGNDAVLTIPIGAAEAERGVEIRVPIAPGGTRVVRVPSGTTDGRVLRLQELGFPDLRGGDPGDQLITLDVIQDSELASRRRSRILEQAAGRS